MTHGTSTSPAGGLLETPKHADLIYDVGLHKGEDTWFYLQKGFRVVSFEADPALVQHCRERFAEFLSDGRLTIVEGAIVPPDFVEKGGDKVRFYSNPKAPIWGTADPQLAEFIGERYGAKSEVVEVDAIDFAGVMQKHGVPHYLKIDIEGLDMACVEALDRFRERPDYVSMESSKSSFEDIAREINTLARLGYDAFQSVDQAALPRKQTPPNPPREGRYVPFQFQEGSTGLFGAELGGKWRTREEVLRQYRVIRLGYYLCGEHGILRPFWPVGPVVGRAMTFLTGRSVPGWHDTHARHASASTGRV